MPVVRTLLADDPLAMLTVTAQQRRRSWDRRLARADIEFTISDAACAEAMRFIESVDSLKPVGSMVVSCADLPRIERDLEDCRKRVENGLRLALIRPLPGLDARGRRVFAWVVANMFGDPLVQNAEGDRVIAVYARPGNRRVIDGARYHQSREGGGPHTDNVSLPDPWEYLVFSCIHAAAVGGESILIDGFAIHQALQDVPDALQVLERPFWWEYRGLGDGLFEAPIVTYDTAGEPRFRYLRKYLESAHRRAGQPLTDEQVWALDVFDAIIDRFDLQFRTLLQEGEILITVDSQVLHARTAFADSRPGGPPDAAQAAEGRWRFFDRVWARKRV